MSSLNHFSPIQTTTPLIQTPFPIETSLNERQILLKFVLIGDTSTGKTSIINKFLSNKFSAKYTPTKHNSYHSSKHNIVIHCNDEETQQKYLIQLELWDTSGILPKNLSVPQQSPLKSQKHPKSQYTTLVSIKPQTDSHKNKSIDNTECSPEPDIDLQSFFDDFDAKEAMELMKIESESENEMKTAEIIAKIPVKKDGYSSSDSTDQCSTNSADISMHDIDLNDSIENKQSFDEIIFSSLDALILVYDITNKDSLANLNGWIELFAKNTEDSQEIPLLVLGNKNDLSQIRMIPYTKGKKFTQSLINHAKLFREISAKEQTRNEIKEMFVALSRMCIDAQSSILQLTSAESYISDSASVCDGGKPISYKRMQRSNDFSVKTCAQNFCNNNKDEMDDRTFCVVL